jgi:membrane fusion protein, multidrug efflux system
MRKFLLVLLSVFLVSGCSKKPEKKVRPPANVVTAIAKRFTIPHKVNAIGNVRAFNSAMLQAQVEGVLVDVHFQQGTPVKQGELLFTIDPRPYIAELEEAEAKLLKDEAELLFNIDRVERYTPLVKEDYVSQLDYDNYVTNVRMSEAQVLQDKAEVELAKVRLDYCYVRAPFDAVASRRLIDMGNLIANEGQDLLRVNQIQPIYVDLAVSEKYVIAMLEKQAEEPLKVHVQPSGSDKIFLGEVLVIGNEVNKKTGMISVRAQFLNEEMLLWPGQFSKAHIILEEVKDAVMVPETAVNLGQNFYYSYVMQGKKAVLKKVKVGLRKEKALQILEGISEGDEVVVDGQINVVPGANVNVKSTDKKWMKDINNESF